MKYLKHRHAVLIASDMNVIIAPYFRNCMKVILYPCFAAFPDTMTFAAAPIIVMFPPRHAPSERLHHSGYAYSGPIAFSISRIMGAIVAV